MNFFYLKVENRDQSASQLKESLKNFGLRPADWVIKSKSENTYRIENSETPDFYFEGVTKNTSANKFGRKFIYADFKSYM